MYNTVYKRQGMPPAGNFEDSTIVKKMRMSEPESFRELHSPVEKKWQSFLIKYMEPDLGLLDRLLSYELLSKEESLAVKIKVSVREKNETILNYILRENRYPELIEVLKETNQSHLVNYLTPDRLEILDVSPCSSERLVPYKEEMTMTVNREILLELIEGTSDLSQKLQSIGVLNKRQEEYISGQPGDIKRNEVLLDILSRGTIGNYEKTICCLRSSGQQHVADILEGGATARARCWLMNTSKGIVQRVELYEIVTRFSERLDEEAEVALKLKVLGLKTVKLDKEISFYFHFKTMEKLENVRKVFDSGEMKVSAERDFESLQLPLNPLSISLEWPKNDFERCLKYFYHVSSTTIDSLPTDVLEMILLRVFGIRFCPLSYRSSEEDTLRWLCSVSRNWAHTITSRRFKSAEDRLVSRFLQTIFKWSAIIMSNHWFLEENLEPNVLIDPLVSADCLTMKQAELIRSIINRGGRNFELLHVISSLPFEKQGDFLECLRSAHQHRVADVIEKGGVTVKMSIRNWAIPNVSSLENALVDKLQKVLSENSDEKLWPHKLFNSVSIYDIVILSVQQDGGLIELWLWCHSQEALDRLRDTGEGELIKITKQLFSRFQSYTLLKPQIVSFDSRRFQVDVVEIEKVQKVKKRSAILKNNREYLVNEIQPNELIPQLVQSGCLTQKQVSSLKGLQNETEKNSELLRMARSFSFVKHFAFMECLYLTNQLNAAKIVERGGGTVKMCMTNEATSDASAVEKHLVDKLQEMLRESSDEKLWPHKLFNSVSIYDIVILSAQQGRGVIELWLWCQSQEALERLRDIDEGELIKITEQLFSRFQSSTILKPQTASIDSNYFVYDVVVRPMSEKLRGFLLCPFDKNSFGRFSVSSLQDKIYATSDRTTIYIYEDKAPYTQLECKINLPPSRMRNPLELAACQVNRCLYIVDRAENCIWKMNPADNYELKKWLSEPLPKLSVSSDGKVFLILDNDRTNPQLRVYTSDAELESTIPLRGDSYMYSWTAAAVELKPGVVAVQYEKFGPRGMLKGISIMRLNETGDILRDVECERSFRLVPYSAGRLIAVDQDENKVILLDDQLKPLQVILSNENRGSEWPRCFCYRKDTRELIVNHFGGGVVSGHYQFDVYKLSFSDD